MSKISKALDKYKKEHNLSSAQIFNLNHAKPQDSNLKTGEDRTTPENVDVDAAEMQIRVNVLAATRLAHAAIRGMSTRGRGAVINVSSGAAYVPSLYNSAYSGTKAYLAIFSLTIAEELRNSGIDVVTVFPGFTRTEFQDRARFDVSRVPRFLWQDASQVVTEALAALESGHQFCVPGIHNKVSLALNHLVPYSLMGRVAGILARFVP